MINIARFRLLLQKGIFGGLVALVFLMPAHSAIAQFAGGDGSAGDPFQITTAQQLSDIRNNLAAHYILTADIDLTTATRVGGALSNGGLGWAAIGNLSTPFTGSLNGNGHTITGLYINGGTRIGMFSVASGATFSAVALENVEIIGNFRVGALVGETSANTLIENSHVTGSVAAAANVGGMVGVGNGGSITGSFTSVNVTGSSDTGLVGGLLGYSQGLAVTSSYATGSVQGVNRIGGLIGEISSSGSVANSFATGNVTGTSDVGGLVGRFSTGSITNSYATGNVVGGSIVGGLVGYITSNGTITNSYASGAVTGDSSVGGFAGSIPAFISADTTTNVFWNTETSGQQSSARGTGLTSEQMRQQASFPGFDFTTTWQIQAAVAFPALQANLQNPLPGLLVAPGAPTINVPSNAAIHVIPRPQLTWTDTTPETLSKYQLQVSVNADFSAPFVDESDLSAAQFSFVADLNPQTIHHWRVRAVNAAGESAWTQASFTTMAFAGGAGTEGNPWQVATADHLNALRDYRNDFSILTANIDLTAATREGGAYWHGGLGWEPIGRTLENQFQGSLNGNGFNITGLHINREAEDYVGLFGRANNAKFTNLAVQMIEMSGASHVGGVVGDLRGADAIIQNSYVTGTVNGFNDFIGGLAGELVDAALSNSYATASVRGDNHVGGLVGSNSGAITNSYATGGVTGSSNVGGLAGNNTQTITNSYAIGSVGVIERGLGDNIGGLLGLNSGTVTNSFWNTLSSGQDNSAGGTGLTSAEMLQQAFYTGFDFAAAWQMQQGFSYPVLQGVLQNPAPGLSAPAIPVIGSPADQAVAVTRQPVLSWTAASAESAASTTSYTVQVSVDENFATTLIDQTGINGTQHAINNDLEANTTYYWRVRAVNPAGDSAWRQARFTTVLYTTGAGTEGSPWQIGTAAQLDQMRNNLNAHYILTANIDLTTATRDGGSYWNGGLGWEPVGTADSPFTGGLNGGGFKITGLFINRADPVGTAIGLIGVSAAEIGRLGLENVDITGVNRVGGLVGEARNNNTITGVYVTGSVQGSDAVGGVVGLASPGSTITNSYAIAAVTGISNVGGLVGSNSGAVTNSYAAGSVTGATDVGGLIGASAGGSATNSYWNTDTSNQNNSSGGTGLTSTAMRQQASFTGFDFGVVWQIQNGFTYPVLQSLSQQSPVPGLVSPAAPTLTAPVNAATDVIRRPLLDWAAASAASEAVTATYHLQISVNADFSEPVVNLTELNTTQHALSSDLEPATTIYWRVQAVNPAGNSAWLEASFTTAPFTSGDGTADNPWQIGTPELLDHVRRNLAAHYVLGANINLTTATGDASGAFWNDGAGWEPIGTADAPFTGGFDGNGFIITGLHIDRSEESLVGLFGNTDGNGNMNNLKNLALEGGSVSGASDTGAIVGRLGHFSRLTDSYSTVNVNGSGSNIGGLVGYMERGFVTNSHASGSVSGASHVGGLAGSNTTSSSVAFSSAKGRVDGTGDNIGGLVGQNRSEIVRSYATGNVTGAGASVGGLAGLNTNSTTIAHSYATGSVSGGTQVGGLVGYNEDQAQIYFSYATGSVTGNGTEVGGLVGRKDNNTIVDGSYWNATASGQESSAGGTALTTAEMRQQASFAGFNFTTIWQIQESEAFPVIRDNTQSPPPGQLVVPPVTTPEVTPPAVINNESQGGVFSGNVNINPGGVLNGGQITGTVQNSGEIRGDVTLGANTTINGGTVSGNVSGNPEQPAVINGANITAGTTLNNVVIGSDTVLDPDVKLGPNVKFASTSAIPSGIDLTTALPSRSWAGGDGRSVPDLSGDVITPVDGVSPDSTVNAIRLPPEFVLDQVRQDGDTGELIIVSGNLRATVIPGRVRQASPDQEQGVFISDDGDLVMVTANGREITSQPVLANKTVFNAMLSELGLESQFGDSANLRLTNPDSDADGSEFLSARPDALSFPATIAEEEGLHFRPVPGLNGASVAVMVYRDENGNLMQQDLVPVPSDWPALKSNLASIDGVGDVRIDAQGTVSATVNGQTVRGQMQYEVTSAGSSDEVPAEGSVLIPAGDVNGDGTDDFRVVYADGSSQVMLIFADA